MWPSWVFGPYWFPIGQVAPLKRAIPKRAIPKRAIGPVWDRLVLHLRLGVMWARGAPAFSLSS